MRNKAVTIVLTLVLFCGLFPSVLSVCELGWFGSACQYKCRCTDNDCELDGICISGSTCVFGWFGPACQYVDLATEGNSNIPSLTDSDDATCNENKKKAEVVFKNPKPFTWMRIRVKDPDQVQNVLLQFKPHGSYSIIDCKNPRKATVSATSMDIHCNPGVAVDAVILTGKGVQSLCSVYISGGRNVALRQNTTQSSRYMQYVSEIAVDGMVGTYFTHTDRETDKTPTWNVTFTQPKFVNRYVIHNRHAVYTRIRLQGFVLQSFRDDGSVVFNYTDKETSPKITYRLIPIEVKEPVSKVMIRATHEDSGEVILSLEEVEVFGDSACSNGKYGLDCDQLCRCGKGKTCFVSTGGCPSGCASGFFGKNCKTECPSKYYGKDCEEKCSSDCFDELCNATTGVCIKCTHGKMGSNCHSDCPPKRFGPGCIYECPFNCNSNVSSERICDSVSGTCTKGCNDGYLGSKCNEVCSSDKYGKDCMEDCGINCKRDFNERTSICDHRNGHCMHGCIEESDDALCGTIKAVMIAESKTYNSCLKIGIGVSCVLLVFAHVVFVTGLAWFKRV